jgi:multimeric flavodoxin WrbA
LFIRLPGGRMKVVAFNGSVRKDGNTALLLNTVLEELAGAGIETELFNLAGKPLPGCIGCFQCFKNKDGRCAVNKDILNECVAKMAAADGILLGSPTYFADVSAGMKALIERAGMVSRANGDLFKRKVGAGVVAVRRAGAYHVLESLNAFFLIGQMIVPGSSYWNIGVGREPGEVAGDAEGMKTMRDLGQNMAWLLKKLQ